jgi:hypothetical protein
MAHQADVSPRFCNINTFTASIFLVFHQFSKVDREFNSMNIQRRNVSSERILILLTCIKTTSLFHQLMIKAHFEF